MDKKITIKIFLILLISYFLFLSNTETNISNSELINLKITVKSIEDIGSNKSSDHEQYRIYAENYNNEFILDSYAGNASNWRIEENVIKNEMLEIGVLKKNFTDINKKNKIKIYSMKKGNEYIFNLENYLRARTSHENKINILGYIILVFIACSIVFNLKNKKTKI